MTVGEWLIETMVRLRDAGVDSPRRDALVLLEDTLEKDRTWVTTHPEHKLGRDDLKTVNDLIQQRIERTPLAYIRDKAWFYGRFFTVNEHTLIPRPESESFIEILKELQPSEIIDIGTGSGALAITAALELPGSKVTATDIDSDALEVAQKNSTKHGAKINFLLGDLLEPLTARNLDNSVVIANLPYVPEGLVTSPEITQEPALALYSGKNGMAHYEMFWKQAANLIHKPTHMLTESLETQHEYMQELATLAGYAAERSEMLVQVFTRIKD